MEVSYRLPQSWSDKGMVWTVGTIDPYCVDYYNAIICALRERCVVLYYWNYHPHTTFLDSFLKTTFQPNQLPRADFFTNVVGCLEFITQWFTEVNCAELNDSGEPPTASFRVLANKYNILNFPEKYITLDTDQVKTWLIHAKNFINDLVWLYIPYYFFGDTYVGKHYLNSAYDAGQEVYANALIDVRRTLCKRDNLAVYDSFSDTPLVTYYFIEFPNDRNTVGAVMQSDGEYISGEWIASAITKRKPRLVYGKDIYSNLEPHTVLLLKTIEPDYSYNVGTYIYDASTCNYQRGVLLKKNYGYLADGCSIYLGCNNTEVPLISTKPNSQTTRGFVAEFWMVLDFGVSGAFKFRPANPAVTPSGPDTPFTPQFQPQPAPEPPPIDPTPTPADPTAPVYPPDTPWDNPPYDPDKIPHIDPDYTKPYDDSQPPQPPSRSSSDLHWDLPYYYNGGEYYGLFINKYGQWVIKGSDAYLYIGWDYDKKTYGYIYVYLGGFAGSSEAYVYRVSGVALSNLIIWHDAHVCVGKIIDAASQPSGPDSYLSNAVLMPGQQDTQIATTGAAKNIVIYNVAGLGVLGKICGIYRSPYPQGEPTEYGDVSFSNPSTNLTDFENKSTDAARAHLLTGSIPSGSNISLKAFRYTGRRDSEGKYW